eukprot:scaffold2072_cov126-Isochrysis_galbana.AAC.7
MNFPMSADPSSDDGTSAMAGSSAAGVPATCDLLYYLVRIVGRTCKCFRHESGLEMAAELPIMSSVAMALREHVFARPLLLLLLTL